jgi:hypothetical protein
MGLLFNWIGQGAQAIEKFLPIGQNKFKALDGIYR